MIRTRRIVSVLTICVCGAISLWLALALLAPWLRPIASRRPMLAGCAHCDASHTAFTPDPALSPAANGLLREIAVTLGAEPVWAYHHAMRVLILSRVTPGDGLSDADARAVAAAAGREITRRLDAPSTLSDDAAAMLRSATSRRASGASP